MLIDREAVQSGAAASGTPWQYFDLGHGYCTYNFFEQCPHRMACARCDFYLPKVSTQAQLFEPKDHLQRMLTTIPLTEPERAAAEDGAAAVEQLLADSRTYQHRPGPRRARSGEQRRHCLRSARFAGHKELDAVIPQNHNESPIQ